MRGAAFGIYGCWDDMEKERLCIYTCTTKHQTSKTATTHITRYKSKTTTKLQTQIIYYLGGEKVYIILSPHAHLARIESDN